jgi:predicted ribosome quality control (RQC) complex YloA/Tae2 family protein
LNLAARLRNAQERSLKGERAADELRAAQAEERDVIQTLTQRAGDILREAERPASGTTLERVSSLLRAAAVAEPGRTSLREGRLSGDVEVSGFDAFAGLEVSSARRSAPAGDDLAERRRQKREAAQRRKKLERQVRELSARAEVAEQEAERARRAAEKAEAAAEERRREADSAASELESLDEAK